MVSLRIVVLGLALLAALGVAQVSAHPHQVTTGNGEVVVIANGQNHPGFVFNPETGLYESCAGIAEPADIGPAGYGLETAHHGPDAGDPGKGDGCYASPDRGDRNPAID